MTEIVEILGAALGIFVLAITTLGVWILVLRWACVQALCDECGRLIHPNGADMKIVYQRREGTSRWLSRHSKRPS